MAHRFGSGIVVALLVAACGSPAVTPPPATPTATWDPRRDEIDQAEAVWTAEQPDTYAYTSTRTAADGTAAAYRVTGMDGRVELQVVDEGAGGAPGVDRSMTIEGLYDTARAALDGDGDLRLAVDQLYGYLSRLAYGAPSAAGSWDHAIEEFSTPATRSSAARAREALERAQERWAALRSPAWEYTWTRFAAADTPGSATSWRVHHEDGKTTVSAADGTADATPPDAVTIDGTVSALASVLAAGGWVDLSTDADTGLDLTAAVDPSPSVRGDAYWIRVDYTDLAARQAAKALAAARDRWAAAGLKRYAYSWRYEGAEGAWSYTVTVNGDKVSVKAGEGAPPVGDSFAAPRIAETFDLVERVLAAGGTVTATYDKKLGYPSRIVLPAVTESTPEGEITITGLRTK